MADNNQGNDEYVFTDIDVMSPDLMGEEDNLSNSARASAVPVDSERSDVKRNAIIVVVLVVVAMLVYKFMGSFFTTKTEPASTIVTETPVITPVVEPQPIIQPQIVTPVPSADTTALNQKISDMDVEQHNLRNSLNTLNNQLNSMSSNINALNMKISTLSQTVTVLTNKMDEQATQVSMLIAARVQQPKPRKIVHRVVVPQTVYYIQAVIPGRAWLISTNGSTLTVREGTNIAGYGIVKLIDPNQGRVVTSSGRVIRFSQQDS